MFELAADVRFEDMESFSAHRQRRLCCCSRRFAVRDFHLIYQHVNGLNLTNQQKNLMLMRYVHIMDKVKNSFGTFTRWYNCTKSCLIVGNITVPSVMSVQAFMQSEPTAQDVVFWSVFTVSVMIAIISSFVTFCNTQRKYNLFNQFNTKIQREMWAFLTLTGRYTIRRHHRRFIAADASPTVVPESTAVDGTARTHELPRHT